MPTSQLFGVDNSGHVFNLSTDQSAWRELPYIGIEFKRLASHESVIWALGGDHQVYVYVYGSSVPIRVCEESYENQRWNPMESFTSNLLPTDRAHFSTADGLTDRTLASIHLPTLAWTWEGPWHLHDTFQGQALDKEAWTYSIDFPRSYTADKRWNSCVRRRKWVRYRRYVALDTWSAVPPIHQDHTKEPFIDISVGGGEVPGEDADKLMVWGVTALNRVMVREGVCGICPEGVAWTHVPTPADQDVISVSVGRSGRVWAVTWDGVALVRTGISRDNPTGTEWRVVESPPEGCLQHIAVGVNVVWALTREHKVWFRRGFTNDQGSPSKSVANKSEQTDVVLPSDDPGTSWLLMVGALNMISVGPNDQVWGVTAEDHIAVIRTGVAIQELAGRTWRPITLPMASDLSPEPSPQPSPLPSREPSPSLDYSRKQSLSVLSNTDSYSRSPTPSLIQEADVESMEAALSNLRVSGQIDGITTQSDMKSDEVGGIEITENVITIKEDIIQNNEKEKEIKMEGNESNSVRNSESLTSQDLSVQIKYPEENSSSLTSSVISDGTSDYLGVITAASSNSIPNSVVPMQSSHIDNRLNDSSSQVKLEEEVNSNAPGTTSIDGRFRHESHESNGSLGSSIFSLGSMVLPREELPTYTIMPMQEGHLWMWLTGGGCWTQANNMPKWFVSETTPQALSGPWRKIIRDQIHQRNQKEVQPFSGYEEAFEGTSWVISGQCRWWASGNWSAATLELEMVGSRRSQVKDATIIIHYTHGTKKKKEIISCCSVLLSGLCVEPPSKFMVVFFMPSAPHSPKSLLFSSETDAEEWLNHIATACNQFRGLNERPSTYCVYSTTAQGDIYVHDSSITEEELRAESQAAHQELDIGKGSPPFIRKLDRGLRPGCFISISGQINAKAKEFYINLQTTDKSDANVALHINPRFSKEHSKKVAILNTKENGSWGKESKQSLTSLSPGKPFEIAIVCDDRDFKISLNDKFWCSYKHRISPGKINHVGVHGEVTVSAITYNHGAGERQLNEWYWRGISGHLRLVEGGVGGVTWAISYDYHAYFYTGAQGGGLYRGSTNEQGIHTMSDIRHMYVWENQRWNPVTGFTYRGLPTDRHTWSDQSGRQQRTKEGTKLPSRQWTWTSEWCIDYNTPCGVDKEGWQYATDFPLSFHGYRYISDLVRRRRWVRKCRISTSGPWQQMEKVSLLDVSVSPEYADDGSVPVWGISVTGEVVYRQGVTPTNPCGTKWTLLPSECPLLRICGGVESGVWGVSKDGRANLRIGVTKANPKGSQWINVDAPNTPLSQISTGGGAVWGVDVDGGLYRRVNVQPLFPEGTSWELICGEVTSLSVGGSGQVWSVLQSFETSEGTMPGVLVRRYGITPAHPSGTGWEPTSGTGWSHVSARVPLTT